MAKATGQVYLYNFIYHATSKVVHFDIFTLLSTGWGKIDKSGDIIKTNFSFQHDYRHYFTFCLFYSSYLFLKQTENFKDALALPNSVNEKLSKLDGLFENNDWPELITFRQLNLEPPSKIIKAMHRVVQKKP